MKNKVKRITQKVPQISTLPDGVYDGVWGGFIIDMYHNGKQYQLETEIGVKGFNIKVSIEVKDGIATFDIVK